jgi:hypothetical protein
MQIQIGFCQSDNLYDNFYMFYIKDSDTLQIDFKVVK